MMCVMQQRFWLIGSLIATLALSGCDTLGDDANDAAHDLATAVEQRSFENVEFTDPDDATAVTNQIKPMADSRLSLKVGEVKESGDSAQARLMWTWAVEGRTWKYQTTGHLKRRNGSWLVDWKPETLEPNLTAQDQLRVQRIAAPRGRILGADDATLVTDRPVKRIGIDKSAVPADQAERSARELAKILDIDRDAYADRVTASGPKAFVEALTLRSDPTESEIPEEVSDVAGILTVDDSIPLAPTREFAAPVLGSVGPATAEIIKKSKGAVAAGDTVGLSGLQARYDNVLAGDPGVRVIAVKADGASRSLFSADPARGKDLHTTLNLELQMRAEEALATLGSNSPPSAIVAIQPSTGHLLAVANGAANKGFNAAMTGRYAPGSTFKVVTALGLLRAGLDPDTTLTCAPTVTVDGRIFKNYDGYPSQRTGSISFTSAIANSCNTALIGQRDQWDPDQKQTATALGLGVDHDLGFSAYFGQTPPAEGETTRAAQMIGQGRVLASPMAMANVMASIVEGQAVVPVLLPNRKLEQQTPRRPLTAQEAEKLQSMTRAVVADGSARFLADLGGTVMAKTGTAEYGKPDQDGELKTHAWMIGARDDLAVAAFVETGGSGSTTAGPLLREILR